MMKREIGLMQRLQDMLRGSIRSLQPSALVDPGTIEALAGLIYDSMSTPGRLYHTAFHTFDVTRDLCWSKYPISVLAALFHDIIYLTVDQRVLPAQEPFLRDIVRNGEKENSSQQQQKPTVCLPSPREKWDWALILVDTLFGGLKPPPGGNSNEYLSAIVAVRALQDTLSNPKDLVALTACVEASVAFRPNRPDGSTPMDALYERLQDLVETAQKESQTNGHAEYIAAVASLTDAELVQMVQEAAVFANHDLSSFASPDTFWFLETSWQLLPEWWQALAVPQPPLRELYSAIKLLTQRYEFTPTERLFPTFRDQPSIETLTVSRQRCRANLQAAGDYSFVRLCELGTILQALRLALGEKQADAKIISMGGIAAFWKHFDTSVRRHVGDASGQIHYCHRAPTSMAEQLLLKGRPASHSWDPAESAWAIYLCKSLGFEDVVQLAKRQVRGEDDDNKKAYWLESMPVYVVEELVRILKDVLPDDAKAFDGVLRYRLSKLYFL